MSKQHVSHINKEKAQGIHNYTIQYIKAPISFQWAFRPFFSMKKACFLGGKNEKKIRCKYKYLNFRDRK